MGFFSKLKKKLHPKQMLNPSPKAQLKNIRIHTDPASEAIRSSRGKSLRTGRDLLDPGGFTDADDPGAFPSVPGEAASGSATEAMLGRMRARRAARLQPAVSAAVMPKPSVAAAAPQAQKMTLAPRTSRIPITPSGRFDRMKQARLAPMPPAGAVAPDAAAAAVQVASPDPQRFRMLSAMRSVGARPMKY